MMMVCRNLINERPQPIAGSGPSNLVERLTAEPDKTSLPQIYPVYTSRYRSQRCFSQFDRKTDCFDGRRRGSHRHAKWEICLYRKQGKNRDQPLPSSCGWLVRYCPFEYRAGVMSSPTFKAVCGTQTRMPRGLKSATHDGFRPDRTGLRKTPSSWLPANEIQKGHPGFMVSRTDRYGKAPFLVGVYDLGMGNNRRMDVTNHGKGGDYEVVGYFGQKGDDNEVIAHFYGSSDPEVHIDFHVGGRGYFRYVMDPDDAECLLSGLQNAMIAINLREGRDKHD